MCAFVQVGDMHHYREPEDRRAFGFNHAEQASYPWLSDGAQILDRRQWREWTRQSSTMDVLWQTNARMSVWSLQHKY